MRIYKHNINDVFKSPICTIETMEIKGYKLIDNLFVDNSGFGSPDEPAYTASQFMDELKRIVKREGMVYTTITDQGTFQVYVGIFKKTGASIAHKIANNTYDVIYSETHHAIRLHDTNIIDFNAGVVKLDTGGWDTLTTRSRMNQYLPSHLHIIRKKGESFVVDDNKNITMPLIDGIKIEL